MKEQIKSFFQKVGSAIRIFNYRVATRSKISIKHIVLVLFIFICAFLLVAFVTFWFVRQGPPE
ncbi:MAG: hypothetical protein ACOC7U_05445, partial [Spirochaetota bacterium]